MLLREIRYMKYLEKQGIPADGLELYARNEKLQVHLDYLWLFLQFSLFILLPFLSSYHLGELFNYINKY